MKRLPIAILFILLPMGLFAQGGASLSFGVSSTPTPGSSGTIVSGVGGGTAQVQTATPNPPITSYISGGAVLYCFTPVANNTGAGPTLNFSSLGAKPVVKNSNGIAPLAAGDWVMNVPACHTYDGTEFLLINPGTTASSNSGTVIHTAGNLTANQVVVGNGGADLKVDTGVNVINDIFPAGIRVGDMLYCSSFSSVCTAWSILPGNNSGTQFLQETNAGVPSWASSAGTVAWGAQTNPAGNLALTMGSNLSSFSFTTPLSQAFSWKNTIPATVSASQSSPIPAWCGTEWHSGASVEGCVTLQFVPGNGLDAASTIVIGHTGGATGPVTVTTPGSLQAGSNGGTGSVADCTEGTTATANAGHDIEYCDSTSHAKFMSLNGGSFFRESQVICSGQIPLSSGAAIGSGVRVANTLSCTGLVTTGPPYDKINCTLVGDTNAVTGYGGTTVLTLKPWISTNTINLDQVNTTGSSITPGAATANCAAWR